MDTVKKYTNFPQFLKRLAIAYPETKAVHQDETKYTDEEVVYQVERNGIKGDMQNVASWNITNGFGYINFSPVIDKILAKDEKYYHSNVTWIRGGTKR